MNTVARRDVKDPATKPETLVGKVDELICAVVPHMKERLVGASEQFRLGALDAVLHKVHELMGTKPAAPAAKAPDYSGSGETSTSQPSGAPAGDSRYATRSNADPDAARRAMIERYDNMSNGKKN